MKKKTIAAILAATTVTMNLSPLSARAADGNESLQGGWSPQQQIWELARNGMSTFLAGIGKDLLFPPDRIDYDRIRHDMEDVVQQKIVSAEIDKAIGYFDSAVSNSATDMKKADPVSDLEETRKQ